MGAPPGPTGVTSLMRELFHVRIGEGRKTKAGKQHSSVLFVKEMFFFSYKFLLKMINDDSVNHEKGYLPCVPKDLMKLGSVTG